MGRLEGKVAIVTGGAMGQGAGIVRAYVAEGAHVVVADVAKEPGQALAEELGATAHFADHDVSDPAAWATLVADTNERFGPVNVLANNAGILRFGTIEAMPVDEVELLWRVNQLGCWLGMQAVVPTMKAHGGGSIVNASSTEGLGGMANTVAYGATKFAIRGMTKGASHKLGPFNIRVNSVHPGMIDTPMTRVHGGDLAMEYGASKVPLRRVGHPEDVAPLYVFLGSDESSYINGAEIAIDGGVTATHAFGGCVANQRAQIVMAHDEIVEFLHQQRSATVATYGPQGQVHLVGMWYAVKDNTVWIETKSKSQKVLNLRRDPRMSFLVEAGQTYDQLRGVALEGRGVIIEDPDVVWDVCVDVFNRYNGEYSEEMKPFVEFMAKNRVVVRLDVDRTRSWDHRKLGLPAMELGGSTAPFVE